MHGRPWIIGLVNRRRQIAPLSIQDPEHAHCTAIESDAWTNQLLFEIRDGPTGTFVNLPREDEQWLRIEGELEEIFNAMLGRPFSFTSGPQVVIIETIKGYLGFT